VSGQVVQFCIPSHVRLIDEVQLGSESSNPKKYPLRLKYPAILPNPSLDTGVSSNSSSASLRFSQCLVIIIDLRCYINLNFVYISSPKVVMVMVVYRARGFCEQKKQQSRQRKSRRAEDPAPYVTTSALKPPCIESEVWSWCVDPLLHRLSLSAKEITVLERS
jgi:hypothetical protein